MSEEQDYLNNSLSYSVDFQYPEESGSLSEQERIDYLANQKTQEFLGVFLSLIIPAHNPRLACVAIAYAAGYPIDCILGCENSMTAIASRIGVTKQSLSLAVKQVSQQFSIRTSTGINHDKTHVYRESNFRG